MKAGSFFGPAFFVDIWGNGGFSRDKQRSGRELVCTGWSIVMTLSCYGWSFEAGDPTMTAWLTVGAYFLTAALCFSAYRCCQLTSNIDARCKDLTVSRWIWLGLFLFFLFLGVNKQLDLQTLFSP